MKILFIAKQTDYIDPISIELLSALAKREGYETFLHVLANGNFEDRLRKIQPDIVAYSAMTGGINYYLETNLKVKKIFPKTFSIMGGPHPTFCPEVVKEGNLDAVCVGEADLAWPEFLKKFTSGNIENIDNIFTKKAQAEGRAPIIRPKNKDLDSLPFLDRDLVYREAPILRDSTMRTYMTGRGCPNLCTYCFNKKYNEIYNGKGKICNRMSVDRVCAELRDLKKRYPTRLIRFFDDVFVFSEDDWFNEFIEKYPKEVGLNFAIWNRANYITESILLKLKQIGLNSIYMSIEAGNNEIRNNVLKRNMSRETILKAFLLCYKHKIPTFCNTIFAIPETKIEHDIESLDLNLEAKVTYGEFRIFTPYPKTNLGDYTIQKGYYDGSYKDIHISFNSESRLNCFTKKEKLMQNNLSLLSTVVLIFPWLRNLTVNFLIKLPLTKIYFVFYYFARVHLSRKTYPQKLSLIGLVKNFYFSLGLEFRSRYK